MNTNPRLSFTDAVNEWDATYTYANGLKLVFKQLSGMRALPQRPDLRCRYHPQSLFLGPADRGRRAVGTKAQVGSKEEQFIGNDEANRLLRRTMHNGWKLQ